MALSQPQQGTDKKLLESVEIIEFLERSLQKAISNLLGSNSPAKSTGLSAQAPRLIRFRDAPKYVGMNKNYFNELVRPFLQEIPIGSHGIAFDRVDLDNWVDQYKHSCSMRPLNKRRIKKWVAQSCQDSTRETVSGSSIKWSMEKEYAKALARTIMPRRKNT